MSKTLSIGKLMAIRLVLMATTLVFAVFSLSAPALADDPLNPGNDDPSQSQTADPLDRLPDATQTPEEAPADNSDSDGGVRDIMRNYNPTSNTDAAKSGFGKWAVSLLSSVTGYLALVVTLFFFLVTVLDLFYITVPFLRPWLADANEDGQGSSLGGGIGGMGMGMRGYGSGGNTSHKAIANRQWVSDAAVTTVKKYGGASQAQVSGAMGMGAPMGGMGMGSMSTGAMQNTDDNNVTSPLGWYGRTRAKELIFMGVILVVLLSSALLGFGMDIGGFILRLVTYLGGLISGADPGSIFNG